MAGRSSTLPTPHCMFPQCRSMPGSRGRPLERWMEGNQPLSGEKSALVYMVTKGRTDLPLRNSGALARVTNLPGKDASKKETDSSCLLLFLQAKRVSFLRETGSFCIVFISLYGHLS